jgi:hypothetical protein
MILAAALENLPADATQEEVEGVLGGLLDVEGATAEVREAVDLLVTGGFANVMNLRGLDKGDLKVIGLSVGEAAGVFRALTAGIKTADAPIHGPGGAGIVQAGANTTATSSALLSSSGQSHRKAVDVAYFPELLSTGYPGSATQSCVSDCIITSLHSCCAGSVARSLEHLVRIGCSSEDARGFEPAELALEST